MKKKIQSANGNHKQARVATPITDKLDFKTMLIRRDEEITVLKREQEEMNTKCIWMHQIRLNLIHKTNSMRNRNNHRPV